jgi:hypothetical protein
METGVILSWHSLSYLFALIGRWIAGRGEMDTGERGMVVKKSCVSLGTLFCILKRFE